MVRQVDSLRSTQQPESVIRLQNRLAGTQNRCGEAADGKQVGLDVSWDSQVLVPPILPSVPGF